MKLLLKKKISPKVSRFSRIVCIIYRNQLENNYHRAAVLRDKNGIGYGGASYGGSSKLLTIKKPVVSPVILPTEENVISGT